MRRLLTLSAVYLMACPGTTRSGTAASDAAPPPEVNHMKPQPPTDDAEVAMSPGSADYRRTLRLAVDFKKGRLTREALIARMVALQLPPHPLGDDYIIAPVPMPPPGVPFDPGQMPADWKDTFGEVAMTYWRGAIDRATYDAIHAAAHEGKFPGFPHCKP